MAQVSLARVADRRSPVYRYWDHGTSAPRPMSRAPNQRVAGRSACIAIVQVETQAIAERLVKRFDDEPEAYPLSCRDRGFRGASVVFGALSHSVTARGRFVDLQREVLGVAALVTQTIPFPQPSFGLRICPQTRTPNGICSITLMLHFISYYIYI